MRTEFGQRLFTARKAAKLTQLKLSKAVGMSQGTYGEVELTGQGSSYTPAIARELGVSVEWLAYGQGEMMDVNNPPEKAANDGGAEFSPFARSLAQLYDSLPKDDLAELMRVLNEACKPILAYKDLRQGRLPMQAPQSNQETPDATPPKPKARSK